MVALGVLAKIVLALNPTLVAAAERDLFPVDAVAYLNAEQPDGQMFNNYNWGGYLMMNAPQYPVYIDGRTDLYTDLVYEYIEILTTDDGWQDRLAARAVNLVLIETGSPLAEALRTEPGWSQTYSDDLASVFVRQ